MAEREAELLTPCVHQPIPRLLGFPPVGLVLPVAIGSMLLSCRVCCLSLPRLSQAGSTVDYHITHTVACRLPPRRPASRPSSVRGSTPRSVRADALEELSKTMYHTSRRVPKTYGLAAIPNAN